MTRRDYETVSRALAAARINSALEYIPLRDAVHLHYVTVVSNALKADNRGFNVEQFFSDCGIPS